MAPFVWAEESSSNALKSIDFRTNKDKEAVIIVELASPAAIVDVKRVQEGLSIDLLNTSVEDTSFTCSMLRISLPQWIA